MPIELYNAGGGGGGVPGDQANSFYEPSMRGATSAFAQEVAGSLYIQPFVLYDPSSFYRMQWLGSGLSSQSTISFSGSVSATGGSSGTAQWGHTGTVLLFSRVSTGTNDKSSNIITFYSTTYSYGANISGSVSWNTSASTASVSFSTSASFACISNIGSTGDVTYGGLTASGANSFSSTSTNQNSFSSSTVCSFVNAAASGLRPIMVPFATSLTPGEYWLGRIWQGGSSSTNYNWRPVCGLASSPGGTPLVWSSSGATGWAELGVASTASTSNFTQGWGYYTSSAGTTGRIALTDINQQAKQLWFNMQALIK